MSMPNPAVQSIVLLRHGVTIGGPRYIGHYDEALSALGWSQMEAAIGNDNVWDAVITSPLRRCYDFAEKLTNHSGTALKIEPGIKEIGFGAWEGLTADTIRQRWPDAYQAFIRDPKQYTPPDAEPFLEFQQRVTQAWSEIRQQYGGRRVLVICHGGPIRLILQYVFNLPWDRVMRIDVGHGKMIHLGLNSADSAFPNNLSAC